MVADHVDFVTSRAGTRQSPSNATKLTRTNREKTNVDTKIGAMPLIPALSRRSLLAFLLVVFTVIIGGCAGTITIRKPAQNLTIILPLKTQVVVTGNQAYSGLIVTVDGADSSNRMVSAGSNRDEGNLNLAAGTHTISASAEMPCWYCTGGKTRSTDMHTFVVSSPSTRVCARSGSLPVNTIPDSLITIAQTSGRKLIAYVLHNGRDALLIIVDDAPGLQQTQMRVELDIDPFNGVTANKAIEAWGFCRGGTRVNLVEASMIGGVNVGTACSQLSAANDRRSGCTDTQTMLLDQSTTSELWLRKSGFLGIWEDAGAMDSSIWQAFGGRSVRFIWVAN